MNKTAITLLSDFGTRDATVTVAKAILMQSIEGCKTVVDISHHVQQYDLQQASYLLTSAYSHFAKGTVHVLAVDIFSGTSPVMVLAEKDGYYFIAPDNGLLPMAFPDLTVALRCATFTKPYLYHDWMNAAAAAIRAIANKNHNTVYEQQELSYQRHRLQTRIMPYGLQCNILYIDRYENVVLNLSKKEFEALIGDKPFTIQVTGKLKLSEDFASKALPATVHNHAAPKLLVTTVSDNYNAAPVGEPLCRFNEAGYLEIALNHDQAATRILGADCRSNLRYKTIDILLNAPEKR